MMGITWWNIVDGCGAPGEPLTSGLFTRTMEPKLSFYALDKLINHEWKTNITFKAEQENFQYPMRGFKGTYKATWTDKAGKTQSRNFTIR